MTAHVRDSLTRRSSALALVSLQDGAGKTIDGPRKSLVRETRSVQLAAVLWLLDGSMPLLFHASIGQRRNVHLPLQLHNDPSRAPGGSEQIKHALLDNPRVPFVEDPKLVFFLLRQRRSFNCA